MTKIDLYTLTGQKSGQLGLPKEIFGVEVNEALMGQAVRVYMGNQRKAKAKVKARSEVRGSRRKIWRQKGTGRARHGDRYAPIFVGGGRAHGPTGQENYNLKMTKKMKRKALFSALTSKFKEGQIFAVKDLEKIEPKTQKMAAFLEKMSEKSKKEVKKKVKVQKWLIIQPEMVNNVFRSGKNIPGVELAEANLLNAYQVLNGGKLILMEKSLDRLKETFLSKKKSLVKGKKDRKLKKIEKKVKKGK